MLNAVAYIVESAVIFAVLINFYKYACYRQTYYKWDRFLLIACIVICYALPFCKISGDESNSRAKTAPVSVTGIAIGEKSHTITLSRQTTIGTIAKNALHSPTFHTLLLIMMIAYIAGAAIKAVSVTAALLKILRLRRGKPENIGNGIKIFTAESRTPAFSFFDNVFVNKAFRSLDSRSQEIILNHERQHIRGYHSIDVIIFAILSIVQWFNPAVKKAAALSRQICENIADSSATEGDKKEYALLLLKLGSTNSEPSPVKPAPEGSSLKDRVLNIYSYDSAQNRKIRFACSLPILLLLIICYLIIGGKISTKNKNGLEFPIKGGYTLAAEYFEDRICTLTDGRRYYVSHPETAFYVPENTVIVAPIAGTAKSVNNHEIAITSGDTTITIKYLSLVSKSNNVTLGEEIGRTSTLPLSIKTEIKNKAIDPAIIFNY